MQLGVADEIEDLLEDLRAVGVEADDEAAVDADAVGLDRSDGVGVGGPLFELPVIVQFQAVERVAGRAFQTVAWVN